MARRARRRMGSGSRLADRRGAWRLVGRRVLGWGRFLRSAHERAEGRHSRLEGSLSRAPLAAAVVGKGIHLERAGGRRVRRRLWRALSDRLRSHAHDDRRGGMGLRGLEGSVWASRERAASCWTRRRLQSRRSSKPAPAIRWRVDRGSRQRSKPSRGDRMRGDVRVSFLAGTTIMLEALPQEGSKFVRWSGACSGSKPLCAVGVDGPKSVAATFAKLADQIAPKVKALPSSGERGRVARLRYRVTEKSGRSREWATIYGNGKALGPYAGGSTTLRQASSTTSFRGECRSPYTWCHVALLRQGRRPDGNRGGPSCASLRIR